MKVINVAVTSDLENIISYLENIFDDGIFYQIDSFDFMISILKNSELFARISFRMDEYTVYSTYPDNEFDDDEFFDTNKFFSHEKLIKLFEQIKRDLNESN